MERYFQNSEREIPPFNAKKPKYNYALTTNVIMNYVIYKSGSDWEKLLHKVFNEHVKVKGNVRFLQTKPKRDPNLEAFGKLVDILFMLIDMIFYG